ncbi:MAG: Gfo/Idh/MocA family protein [Planctomycetota bacterium]|jgi:predicted dehydrogenase
MTPPELRAAAVGVGAFGRHHARIYSEMRDDGVRLVGLVDTDPEGPRPLAEKLGVPLVPTVEDLPEPVDLISVAVPTVDHRRIAEPLLRRGVHCLVEKPLAGSCADAEALRRAAVDGNAVLQVGLVERFNPVMAVGVVMDMMIHDLDIVNHLVGEEAARVDAVGVPVVSEFEDIANARLTFPSGCVANVTASRVSHQRMRRFRIFSREAYLSLDYDKREALLVRAPARGANGLPDPIPASVHPLATEKLPIHDAEPLREEIGALVQSIRNGHTPRVGAGEGIRALALAERILASIGAAPVPGRTPSTGCKQL